MAKIHNEYEINGERYSVEIRSSAILGRVVIRINGDKFTLRSFPFRLGRSEPFKIGDKRCMLTVTNTGKLQID